MEQKELTAQEIVEKLIDEQKISGKEAVILLNAINKPEGKMCLSNGECEDIENAFKKNDWAKIIRYAEKYKIQKEQPHWKPSEEQMEALSETIAFAPDTFKPKCTLITLQNDLKN